MISQHCDHDAISHLTGPPERAASRCDLSFLHQRQSRLDQPFSGDDPIEAVFAIGNEGEVLRDIGEPRQIRGRRDDPCHTV
jgi:hypothetical protein